MENFSIIPEKQDKNPYEYPYLMGITSLLSMAKQLFIYHPKAFLILSVLFQIVFEVIAHIFLQSIDNSYLFIGTLPIIFVVSAIEIFFVCAIMYNVHYADNSDFGNIFKTFRQNIVNYMIMFVFMTFLVAAFAVSLWLLQDFKENLEYIINEDLVYALSLIISIVTMYVSLLFSFTLILSGVYNMKFDMAISYLFQLLKANKKRTIIFLAYLFLIKFIFLGVSGSQLLIKPLEDISYFKLIIGSILNCYFYIAYCLYIMNLNDMYLEANGIYKAGASPNNLEGIGE